MATCDEGLSPNRAAALWRHQGELQAEVEDGLVAPERADGD